jgi:acyl carrier protein
MPEISGKISNIVIEALKELGDEKENNKLRKASKNTKIYGLGGNLDSLSLVLLISNIEEKISEGFGKNITLADEKAMSQKNSPFLSVESLSNYINNLLNSSTDE